MARSDKGKRHFADNEEDRLRDTNAYLVAILRQIELLARTSQDEYLHLDDRGSARMFAAALNRILATAAEGTRERA